MGGRDTALIRVRGRESFEPARTHTHTSSTAERAMTADEHTSHPTGTAQEPGGAWDGELRERLGMAGDGEEEGVARDAAKAIEAPVPRLRGRLALSSTRIRLAVLATALVVALAALGRLLLPLGPAGDPAGPRPAPSPRHAPAVRAARDAGPSRPFGQRRSPRHRRRSPRHRRARTRAGAAQGSPRPAAAQSPSPPAPAAPEPVEPVVPEAPGAAPPAAAAPPEPSPEGSAPVSPGTGGAGGIRDGSRSSAEFGM
jgi:hypothetical protein